MEARLFVRFLPSGLSVEASPGDTILDVALEYGIPLEHDCGGNCACTTCHVLVESGAENLSVMEEVEDDRLGTAANRTSASRLSCQALLRGGEVTVRIPEQDLWE
jgi:ferredoxin, 2Fe-2S